MMNLLKPDEDMGGLAPLLSITVISLHEVGKFVKRRNA